MKCSSLCNNQDCNFFTFDKDDGSCILLDQFESIKTCLRNISNQIFHEGSFLYDYESVSQTKEIRIFSKPGKCYHGETYFAGTNKVMINIMNVSFLTLFCIQCYSSTESSGIKNTWLVGRNLCTNIGGDLPLVADQSTQDFLLELSSEGGWIGLMRVSESSPWVWISGDDLVFTSWAQNKPGGCGQYANLREASKTINI